MVRGSHNILPERKINIGRCGSEIFKVQSKSRQQGSCVLHLIPILGPNFPGSAGLRRMLRKNAWVRSHLSIHYSVCSSLNKQTGALHPILADLGTFKDKFGMEFEGTECTPKSAGRLITVFKPFESLKSAN